MLRPGEPSEFTERQLVRAEFDLDAPNTSLVLAVRVVHQTPIEGRLRIGFTIDPEETVRFEEQCDAVADYVVERQRLALSGA